MANEQQTQNTENYIYEPGQYRYQQPLTKVNMVLSKNTTVDLKKIDSWLEDVFKINNEPYNGSLSLGTNVEQDHILKIIWRILLFRRELVQALRIPIFNIGDIIAIKEIDENYQITVYLSIIEHITYHLESEIFKNTISCITKFFQYKPTDNNRKIIYDLIETKLIKPYKNIIGSGVSTMPILQEAYRRKVPFIYLGNGVYQLGWGINLKIMQRSSVGEDSMIGARLSDNKLSASRMVRAVGLPAPKHALATNYSKAIEIVNKLGYPIVTKPSDLNRGEGVSININNEDSLQKGFELAYKLSKSKQVIVEQQVTGVCCRIFIANEKMYYAVNRLPKSVVGDSQKTVQELIEDANKKNMSLLPWKRLKDFPTDNLAIKSIQDAGYSLKSIPNEGDLVPLRPMESTQWGGYFKDVTKHIHSDNVDIALQATKLFGLHVVGVDIISPDITKPWYENGAIINEVNFSPAYGDEDISNSTISTFLNDLINGSGRIPVKVIIGDKIALSEAIRIQEIGIIENKKVYLTSHDKTIDYMKKEKIMTFHKLSQRIRALLLNKNVEELIIVVQTYDLLETGLPIDNIDEIKVVNDNLLKVNNIENNFNSLMNLLKSVNE